MQHNKISRLFRMFATVAGFDYIFESKPLIRLSNLFSSVLSVVYTISAPLRETRAVHGERVQIFDFDFDEDFDLDYMHASMNYQLPTIN